jgi:GNAT superfamily N-acetyltransferase
VDDQLGPRWTLRPISRADLEWGFALHREALGEYVEQTWGWDEDAQRRMFTDRFDERRRQVIEVDGERVGVVEAHDRSDVLYLALIELAPQWRSKGLGAEILRSLIERAKRSGKPLALHTLRVNTRARSFYEREGLRVIGEEPLRFVLRS